MARRDRAVTRPAAAVALAALVVGCALVDAWYGGGWFLDGPWLVLGSLAAGYLLGAWLPAVPCTLLVAGAAVGLTIANQRQDPGAYPVADDLVFFLLIAGAPAVAGAGLTRRRQQVAELTRLAARIEEQRAADLEAARLEERERIEVSVHRRLIERIGGLVLLAEGAHHHPSRTAVSDALTGIEDAARAALVELRDAVGTLRTSPEPAEPVTGGPLLESARPVQPPPGVPDLALAVAIGAAMAIETLVRDFTRGPALANVVAAMIVALPLVWRRTHPLVAMSSVWLLAAGMTQLLTPVTQAVTSLGLVLVATYAAGFYTRRWPLALALTWAGTVMLLLVTPAEQRDVDGLVPTLVLSTLVLLAGVVAAGAARRAAELRAHVVALEEARDIERRATVATTRLDLARGLHDSVAQAMTIACLQASVARDPAGDPDAALTTVLAAARACMAELRSGLDELDGAAPALDTRALRRLADQAGLDVEWRIDGGVETSAPVGVLVHQVLREGLTNAARHAPGSRVVVRVTDAGDRVDVDVLDDGPGTSDFALGAGSGLAGLREALARRGGTLTAGPRDSGGFRVAASVPLRQEVPA